MARNPPLWGLGVSAGFHQSLGEEIPSAGAWECDWSRLRYQKPGTRWSHSLYTASSWLGRGTLGRVCLSIPQSSSLGSSRHTWRGISSTLPLLFPTHPKAGTVKGDPECLIRGKGSFGALVTRGIHCCDSSWVLHVGEAALPLGLGTGKWVWMCMFIKYLITACRLCHYLSIGEGLKAWAGLFYMARILISLSGLLPSAIPKQFLMPTCLIHSNSRLWSLCPKKRKHFQSKITKVYWSHSYSQWQISKHPSFCLLPFPSSSLHGFFPLKKINFHF